MHIGKAYRKAQTSTSASTAAAAAGGDNQWKSERLSEESASPFGTKNELAKHLLTKLIVSAGTPAKANYIQQNQRIIYEAFVINPPTTTQSDILPQFQKNETAHSPNHHFLRGDARHDGAKQRGIGARRRYHSPTGPRGGRRAARTLGSSHGNQRYVRPGSGQLIGRAARGMGR